MTLKFGLRCRFSPGQKALPDTTETTTTEIVFTRTNLVINPLEFVVLAVIAMAAIWRRVRVRRRKAALGHATQPGHGFAFRAHGVEPEQSAPAEGPLSKARSSSAAIRRSQTSN